MADRPSSTGGSEEPQDQLSEEIPPPPPGALTDADWVRVDTWLWATRQVSTRSRGTAAARAGHVKVNGTTVKAAQKVRIGDEVRLRINGFDRVLIVRALLVKRVGAPQARQCYDDQSVPRPTRQAAFGIRDRGAGRPSKKERRELDRLRGRDSHQHY